MKCYAAFVRQQFHASVIYRFEFWIKILYGIIAMYGAKCLWTALYAQNPAMIGRDLPSMITYAMLAMALNIVFYPRSDNSPQRYMNSQVKKGSIDTDLLRPLDFQRQMLYRNSSNVMFSFIVLVVPACGIAVAFMGMRLPASPVLMAAFLVSVIISYFVLFSLNFMLGLLSMVTLDIKQIVWAYNGLVSLLSGNMIPIWMFPKEAQVVLNALPFRYIYDVPLNIYTGAFTYNEVLVQLGLQAMWAIGLMLLGQWAWRGVRNRLTVQGG